MMSVGRRPARALIRVGDSGDGCDDEHRPPHNGAQGEKLWAGRFRSHQLAPCLTATIRAARLAWTYECSKPVPASGIRAKAKRDLRRVGLVRWQPVFSRQADESLSDQRNGVGR